MIRHWAEWKVGRAGAMKIMRRFNATQKRGQLVCKKCGSQNHLALFEGGLGKCCFVPEKMEPVVAPVRSWTGQYPQLPETRKVRMRCDHIMRKHDLAASRFAHCLGMDHNNFYRWYNGEAGERGQESMNKRVSIAIDNWLKTGCEVEA